MPSSYNHDQQRARVDRLPVTDLDVRDGSVMRGVELVFHLHRFDYDERLAGVYRFPGLDEDADHLAGHRGHNLLGPRAGLPTFALSAPSAPANEGHRHRRRADLDRESVGKR